jgi:uncharacterized protein YjbJ (UPF0337 family)
MNCRQLIGNWKQVNRVVGEKPGKLTDDDMGAIVAKPAIGHEKIRESLGAPREDAEEKFKG